MKLELATDRQRKIADMLWLCETQDQVAVILDVFGLDARVVYDMMVSAALDQVQHCHCAETVLANIAAKAK